MSQTFGGLSIEGLKGVSLAEKHVFVPPKSVSLAEKGVSVPLKSVSLAEKHVSVPPKSVSLAEKHVFVPPKDVSLAEKHVFVPGFTLIFHPRNGEIAITAGDFTVSPSAVIPAKAGIQKKNTVKY